MLDRLPAWARHLAIVFGSVFGLFFAKAVIAAGGIWPFPWADTFRAAVNAGAAAVCAVLALWFTTLVRQYGTGSAKPIGGDSDGSAN